MHIKHTHLHVKNKWTKKERKLYLVLESKNKTEQQKHINK